jgi:tagatose 6-phosphate kinase
MLVTVTLNAAVDKTYLLPRFQMGYLHRTRDVVSLPGGKGINVARVARTLGVEVTATGFVAGQNGRFIVEGCAREGIVPAFVETDGESRTCLTFLDEESGSVTEVLEYGPTIMEESSGKLQEILGELAKQAKFVVFSGSLPAGLPSDTYQTLMNLVRNAGALPVLDTSGAALEAGLRERPHLVKPNREEAEALLGYRLVNDETRQQAVRDLQQLGAERVLLSMGEEGAWFGDTEGVWHFPVIPLTSIANPVGCGDSLLAGVMAGILRGQDWPQAVRLGMASAAANALAIGAGQVERSVVERLLERAALRRIV